MKYLIILILLIPTLNIVAQSTVNDSVAVETLPEFPGGNKAFFKYISKNFNYPKTALRTNLTGQILVRFFIDTEGKVIVDSLKRTSIRFRGKKIDDYLKAKALEEVEAETKRVFESMPNWRPAVQNGKKVKVFMSIPYNFNLE